MKTNRFPPNPSELVASLAERKFLAFTTMDASFVVDIVSVKNVLPYQTPIPWPQLGPVFAGVIKTANSCIPTVEMRSPKAAHCLASLGVPKVIVVDIRGFSIGLAVDRVDGLMALTEEQIQPLDEIARQIQSPFVTEIKGRSGPLALLQIPESLLGYVR